MSPKRVPIAMQGGKVLASLSVREARLGELSEASIEAMIAEDCSPIPAPVAAPSGELLTIGIKYHGAFTSDRFSFFHVRHTPGKIQHEACISFIHTSAANERRLNRIVNALLPYLVSVEVGADGWEVFKYRFPWEVV